MFVKRKEIGSLAYLGVNEQGNIGNVPHNLHKKPHAIVKIHFVVKTPAKCCPICLLARPAGYIFVALASGRVPILIIA